MRFWNWIGIFLLMVTISISSIFVYDRFYAVKIVTLDANAYINAQKTLYIDGVIDESVLKERLLHLQTVVDLVPKNQVVINSEAIIKNGKTLTP